MCVPYTGSEAWTRSMGYETVDEWRPWTSNGQIAGYFSFLHLFITKNYLNYYLSLDIVKIWNHWGSGFMFEVKDYKISNMISNSNASSSAFVFMEVFFTNGHCCSGCRYTQGYENNLTFLTIKVFTDLPFGINNFSKIQASGSQFQMQNEDFDHFLFFF